MQRSFILSLAAVTIVSGLRAQSCTDLLQNGDFEAAWTTAIYGNCATSGAAYIPSWKADQSGVLNRYKCTRSAMPGQGYFPAGANTESWDVSPSNTHYLNWQTTSTASQTNTIMQNLTTPATAGQQYYFRFHYAVYRSAGAPAAPVTFRMGFQNSTSCPGTALTTYNTINPAGQYVPFSSLVWSTYTGVLTAPASAVQFRLEIISSTFAAGASSKVWIDDLELMCVTCKFDFDQDGTVDSDDNTTFTSYYGLTANQLPICHVGADSNGDGTVSVADLLDFIGAFGNTCSAMGVCGSAAMPVQEGLTNRPAVKSISSGVDPEAMLYPNPASNTITIVLPHDIKEAALDIVDESGRVLRSHGTTTGTIQEMDLEGLAPGHYLFRYTSAVRSGVIAFVKE